VLVTPEPVTEPTPPNEAVRRWDLRERSLIVRGFLVILAGLLVGYMFFGRGFAHVAVGPIYIGDVVLVLGVATLSFVILITRLWPPITWTISLLVAFMALGGIRTAPYWGAYGIDALRDGVVWGYAAFALVVYGLLARRSTSDALRGYRWIVPIFAVWLPISWNLFVAFSTEIDPNRPAAVIPFVFFKAGDMAVHTVGAIAVLVLAAGAPTTARGFVLRTLIFMPLLWTIFVAGTANRGALVTAFVGLVATAFLAPHWRSWRPFAAAVAAGVALLLVQGALAGLGASAPTATSEPIQPPSPSATGSAASQAPTHPPSPAPRATREPAGSSETMPDTGPGQAISVTNAGFESGSAGLGEITGWVVRGAPPTISDEDPFHGANFALLENANAPYQATLTSSRFGFELGPDIAISLWAMAVEGEPKIEVYINWYDASGDRIASEFLNALSPDDGTWRRFTGVAPAPAEAIEAEILIYEASGDATVGIDEVAVRAGRFIPEPIQGSPSDGRPATIGQMIDNILSVFGSSSDGSLEGTKQFRLAWWGTIIDYTVFGDYFWTGKGFGVNLANDDGFQSTVDGSLRAPHNTHFTVLARMGVPGLVLWLLLQGAFAWGLLRATFDSRRRGDTLLAVGGAWVFVYWLAMMVDTSFDPYLEGPQGGIWFWVIFGLGLVITRLGARARAA